MIPGSCACYPDETERQSRAFEAALVDGQSLFSELTRRKLKFALLVGVTHE